MRFGINLASEPFAVTVLWSPVRCRWCFACRSVGMLIYLAAGERARAAEARECNPQNRNAS